MTPFQSGMLSASVASLAELDEMLCRDETCQKSCTSSCAEDCAVHAQEEDCLTMWQRRDNRQLPTDDAAACEPCQEHITVQKAVEMLRGVKRRRK